jgi:hypothetical protein
MHGTFISISLIVARLKPVIQLFLLTFGAGVVRFHVLSLNLLQITAFYNSANEVSVVGV